MFISKDLFFSCVDETGVKISEDTFLKFDAYAQELVKYNEKVNLTAVTEPDGIVIKHFADSLYLLKYVPVGAGMSLCDVGTGAGFPGLCLLLATPGIKLTVFDSVNKKLDFIRYIIKLLDIEAQVVNSRAETAGKNGVYRESFDVVTARAVAQLNVLAECCVPLVKPGGFFAPMKARLSDEEARRGIPASERLGAEVSQRFCYELYDGSGREIILFKKNKPTPTKYPRNYSQISKSPL